MTRGNRGGGGGVSWRTKLLWLMTPEELDEYNLAKFLMHIASRPIYPKTACWLWTGGLNTKGGYGRFNVYLGSKRRRGILAHRYAWETKNKKPVPVNMKICHTCDTPLCVRPTHLFLGTQLDNVMDMMHKGRHRAKKGKDHPNFGKHHSAETRAKIAARAVGRKPSAETRSKMSAAQKLRNLERH